MAVEVYPFDAGLGADIGGIDVTQPLAPEDVVALIAAWHDNLVLRIPGQPMTVDQHMAFTRNFGELEISGSKLIKKQHGIESPMDNALYLPPEIAVVSNIVVDGKAIGNLGAGEAVWHSDSSYVDVPTAGSFLHAREVPPAGGATQFLNMYTAYETLPQHLKDRIADLKIVHAATHNSAGQARKGFETVTDVTNLPGAHHPIVRTHPDTGRKALYLGRRLNAYVAGLPLAESEALLDALWEHTQQERFTWTQNWSVGDTVIWDNRCTMHRRDAFDPSTRRLMHRTQTRGTRPV